MCLHLRTEQFAKSVSLFFALKIGITKQQHQTVIITIGVFFVLFLQMYLLTFMSIYSCPPRKWEKIPQIQIIFSLTFEKVCIKFAGQSGKNIATALLWVLM